MVLRQQRPFLERFRKHQARANDLLYYANMISGLREDVRRDLRYDLEIVVNKEDGTFEVDHEVIADFDGRFPNPYVFMGADKNAKGTMVSFFCFELSLEYIDYLKGLIEPYL